MSIQVSKQKSQLQVHVVIASDSKRGGLNHQITTSPTNLRHLPPPPPPPSSQITDERGKKNQPIYEPPPTMSRRHNGPRLDLKLHLSPPRAAGRHPRAESPSRSLTASPTSPPSSCVSSEQDECLRYSSSPEATSMMLVGCPRCLMYVMLAEEDPRCPKCKSTVLLDVIHDNNNNIKTKTSRKG